MKQLTLTSIILLFSTSFAWTQNGPQPVIIKSVRNDQSPALSELSKSIPPPRPGAPREIPMLPSLFGGEVSGEEPRGFDPALQSEQGALPGLELLENWEGISDQDNANIIGYAVAPPDPNMDVGPNHTVQMVNLLFAIWDKQGNLLLGPSPTNILWSGFGGPCEVDNNGDPIVLYDHLADRWILSQFAVNTGNSMCYAVSVTADPTGSYYRYEFPFSDFPDYPKLGVWKDAYYGTYKVFGTTVENVAGAMERDAMLIGEPAQIVLYSMSDILPGIDGVLPVDLDGPAAPEGTPGFFLGFQDSQDRLFAFELSVDWNDLSNTTFTGPFFLPVDQFNSSLCFYARDCIPQPDINDGLDAMSDKTMHRLAFRNFGTHMSMVANHAVDVDGNDHAGIRWYELRDDGSGWTVYQQGTYAPDSDNRWMGSIAMDAAGNIGLAYSVSSLVTYPSIRFAGRTANAPLGVLNVAEVSFFEGTGSQIGSGNRWGDYSSLSVDPVDDGTFWLTNEYYATNSSFNWRTRVGSFSFEPDSIPPDSVNDLAVVDSSINSIILQWTASGDDGSTGTASSYDLRYSTDGAIDESNFDSSTRVSNVPFPQAPGTVEIFEVNELDLGTSYWFAIKVLDNMGNVSAVSNSPRGRTLGMLGDLNGDAIINIFDALLMIGLVLDNEYDLLGDMNGDGEVDIFDIIILINIILGRGLELVTSDSSPAEVSFEWRQADGNVLLDASFAGEVAGLQIKVPVNSLAGEDVELTPRFEGMELSTRIGNGGVTILVYSMEGRTLSGSGTVLTIGGDVDFRSAAILASDLRGNRIPVRGVGNGMLPRGYSLSQNYPNPFNPETLIEFALPEMNEVSLVIYNLRGEEITRLLEGEKSAGYHRINWDASGVASGIYFYRLQAGDYVQTRKMVLLR